jgi:hypothetical protein
MELKRLNLLISQFLDYAEFQALEQNPMTMKDWINAPDTQILNHKKKLLQNVGKVSRRQAVEKAEKEFDIYIANEMKKLESDFDRTIKKLAIKIKRNK